jgi:hypothetical protein
MALAAMTFPQTAIAGDPVSTNAENIRKLDIMLMVTSLRCRTGSDNFQPDYQNFSRAHVATMKRAASYLTADFTRRQGSAKAKRSLDKMSVSMANSYGVGHPWLGCAELKEVTRELAKERDVARLSDRANELLASRPTGYLASR